MNRVVPALLALAMGASAAACVTTRAQTPAARMPALEVPPVPPRAIEPAPPPPLPLPEPVEPLPTAPPTAAAKPRPQQPRENQKPETKPQDPPPPAEQPAVAAAAPVSPQVPPLRTSRTADGAKAERQITDIIKNANALLDQVDYHKLTPERREAYEQAKRFISGAETALREARFDYAMELADKAQTLAKQLQG